MGDDLKQIVAGVRQAVDATLSADTARRQTAEARFDEYGLKEYPKLVYALGEILKDPHAAMNDPVREQASKLLERFFNPRDSSKREKYAMLWTQQSDAFKTSVKGNLVTAMGFPGAQAAALSRAAAYCLAQIAVLEITTKRWPNFCDQMKALCRPAVLPEADEQTVAFRRGAVRVIGVVCDSLQPGVHLQQQNVDSLLGSIVACFKSKSEDVNGSAFDALNLSLKFIEANLNVKTQRDHLMAQVLGGVRSASAKVQASALQCVVSLCDDHYLLIADWVERILDVTAKVVSRQATHDNAKMQAIEVWNSLLTVELDLVDGNRHFMRKHGVNVADVLMRAMIYRDEDVANSEDLAPERSARVALQLLASLLKSKELLAKVMKAVGSLVTASSPWAQREMGFVAMGSIMEVADNPEVAKEMKQYIQPCVGSIGLAIQDNSKDKMVTKDSALWALDRIFVFALDQFPSNAFAQSVLKRTLTIVSTNRDPKLTMRAACCIRSYFKFFSHVPVERRRATVLHFAPPNMHKVVLQAMVRATETRSRQLLDDNLGLIIFDCVHHIVKLPDLIYSAETAEENKPYYKAILEVFVYMTNKMVAVLKSNVDAKLRNTYIAGFCSGLAACLLSFDTDEYRAAILSKPKLTQTLLFTCYEILKLRHGEALEEETLMVITRIVSIMREQIVSAVPSIMAQVKRVIDAKAGDAEVILAIGLISEVYNLGWNSRENPRANDQIFELLMKLVGDKTLSRSTKPLIIEAITCMLGTLQGGFMKYMVRFVHTLSGAMVVGKPTNPVDEEQEETCAFVDKLRSEILMFLSELVQVNEASNILSHSGFLKQVGVFCMAIAQPGAASDEHVGLLCEFIRDLNERMETRQLAAKLMAQNHVKSVFARHKAQNNGGF